MVYNFSMYVINLESGLPTADQAMSRLNNQIYLARSTKGVAAKIIHGYGSSGKGGVIKAATLRQLRVYKQRGIIKDFCPGEKFGPFSEEGRRIVAKFPALRKDSDWARSNDGISIIIFK